MSLASAANKNPRHLHLESGPKPTTNPLKNFKSCGQLSKSHQKLDVILENIVV